MKEKIYKLILCLWCKLFVSEFHTVCFTVSPYLRFSQPVMQAIHDFLLDSVCSQYRSALMEVRRSLAYAFIFIPGTAIWLLGEIFIARSVII